MSENYATASPQDTGATANGDHRHQEVEPCACCRALATKYVAFVPAGSIPAAVTYYQEPPHTHLSPTQPAKTAPRAFRLPNLLKDNHTNGNGKHKLFGAAKKKDETHQEDVNDSEQSKADSLGEKGGAEHEDDFVKAPKKKHLFSGIDGIAIMVLGVILPGLMLVTTAFSCPKRLTLVILNHPLESLGQLLLLLSIPVVNFSIWRALRKNDIRFNIVRGLSLGAASATSLLVSGICVAALFFGRQDLQSEIGSSFSDGFCWLSILCLASAATSAYLIYRFRQTRELPKARQYILALTACGAVLSWLTFVAAEWRPWTIRLAEQRAVANSPKERQEGLDQLRLLDPERELRMECSDPRAAGLSGLFLPLKPSAQQELYFAVTGKPYSFRDANNENFAAMSDEYLSHNVVGEKVTGLSLTRSSLTADVHPRTLSSKIHWTFVFKNETAEPIEARAEMAVPPGAVVTGLTRWHDGEPEDALFTASGNIAGANMQHMGHDTAAMVTDLGRGRVLLHCYPVEPAQQLKVDVAMVVPMKPETQTTASLTMPKFLATNFDTEGEHVLRLQSELPLSGTGGLKQSITPAHDHMLIGSLSDKQLEGAPIIVEAARPVQPQKIAMLDKIADKMKEEEEKRKEAERVRKLKEAERMQGEQVVIYIDGNQLKNQLDDLSTALSKNHRRSVKQKVIVIKPEYVTESVDQVTSAAPKHLVVVIDGSVAMASHVQELKKALARIPASVPVSMIVASQDQPNLLEPTSLSEGLSKLEKVRFQGGQDNLKAVVQGAELAGETKGGALLWIHGPQPTLNSNIYIMKQYVAAPKFYEVALDSGDVDTYEFFKNHSEIGPFEAVPQDKSLVSQLSDFFGKWQPGNSAYSTVFSQSNAVPNKVQLLSDKESEELLQLHAHDTVINLIKSRHSNKAAAMALRYGILSPVSSALLQAQPVADASIEQDGSFIRGSLSSPTLQGVTNGTIGPQGMDATIVTGINTAGTVRVNNLANLEALLNIIANLAEIGLALLGVVVLVHGLSIREDSALFGMPFTMSSGLRLAVGIAVILLALAVPGTINWFVASARDANLFS
ncbi:MAG TPA: hypothetical protein V6C81_23410 [Planktothrix sp.]|jgi:hypothetical protein